MRHPYVLVSGITKKSGTYVVYGDIECTDINIVPCLQLRRSKTLHIYISFNASRIHKIKKNANRYGKDSTTPCQA